MTPSVAVVSVVTPTKNRLELLREAMDSVQAQSYEAWEHIIIDDGSNDGTEEEVLRRARQDPRVRYLQRMGKLVGANVCRNLGVNSSQGEFIVFLDSDDLLAPECLALRVERMQRNADLDFATFQTSFFVRKPGDMAEASTSRDLVGGDLLQFLYFEWPWIISAPIWRKSSLQRLGLLDEALLSWQDVELHIRALTYGCHYLRFPEFDHHVRWQYEECKVSIEQRRSPRHLDAALGVLEKFESLVRKGPGMTWTRQRAICSLYFFVAQRWVDEGHLRKALRTWRRTSERGLSPLFLLASGALLLTLQAWHVPANARVTHKWKGWMHLRSEPELVERGWPQRTISRGALDGVQRNES